MQKMHFKYISLIGLLVITAAQAEDKNHKKRQIYREQVLPHAGGRIPDTAFQTDRLFLNRLQKDGIAVPDGILPEQRNPQVYPFLSKPMRPVYRVALSSDARYTPREGRYHYTEVPSVETTYLYPQVQGAKIHTPAKQPMYPVYKQIQLQNPLLNQIKLQAKNKQPAFNFAPTFDMKNNFKFFKTQSYQNFNMINTPIAPSVNAAGGYQYYRDYDSSNIFNDFDHFFNNLDSQASTGIHSIKLNKYPAQQRKY